MKDAQQLIAAAHEVGHAVVAHVFGIGVLKVEINPDGSGVTRRDLDGEPEDFPLPVLLGWLISDVAGYEAELLWRRHHGGRVTRHQSDQDFAHFNRYRRLAGLAEHDATRWAHSVLTSNWDLMEHLVPQLAHEGRIVPW